MAEDNDIYSLGGVFVFRRCSGVFICVREKARGREEEKARGVCVSCCVIRKKKKVIEFVTRRTGRGLDLWM